MCGLERLLYFSVPSSFFLLELVFILLSIALLTLVERKVLSSVQRRRGPNVIGLFGFLQPFADGLKLFSKEILVPSNSNSYIFMLAPLFTFWCSMLLWYLIPFNNGFIGVELPLGLLVLVSISSLSIHGIIFSGRSSNSKYAFLGGIRSASQMISYEICITTIFAGILLMSGSFSAIGIVEAQSDIWFVVPLLPMWLIFLVSSLAETNRAPFDLPEAEAELVAGYNVEYSAIVFALFFLAEYGNMIIMSCLSTLFFWGGWSFGLSSDVLSFQIVAYYIFGWKIVMNVSFFLFVRAALPRYRYDQLMKLGWKVLIPITLALVMLQGSVILSYGIF